MVSNLKILKLFLVFIFSYFMLWGVFYFSEIFLEPIWFLCLDVVIIFYLVGYVIDCRLFFRFDLIFYLLFPFYFKISFVLQYYFQISLFGLDDSSAYLAYAFCQMTWLFGVFLSLIRHEFMSFSSYEKLFKKFLSQRHTLNNVFLPFIIALLASLFFLYQVRSFISIGNVSYSRLEITELVGHSGWYFKYLVIAYSWIFFCFFLKHRNTISYVQIFFLSMPLVIYFFFQQVVGGRREIVFMLLFALALYMLHAKGKFNKWFYTMVCLGFFLLVAAGALRDFGEGDFIKIATDSLGEFIFPISTFQVHFDEANTQYKAGLTYLYSFTNFIPSSIFPGKPLPLATEFALKVADPGQEYILGYAITPITEAYVNFGIAAIFAFPILLSLFCLVIELLSKTYSILPLVFFSQALNFQRSDIASTFFETLILVVVFQIFMLTTRFRFTFNR